MNDDELRLMVRELLREALPSVADRAPAPAAAEVVTLRTDADLDRFVRRLLELLENPERRDDVRAGRLRFTLGASAPPEPAERKTTRRVDKGAVTERLVTEAARAGETLVLGRRAVLTPLARDKAKALGVAVERES
ncbi:hypothetical protein [Pseudonocardia acaciae]|uniref:hypothetical protein n=1 Tax=Pseudonocardia acaciae TaxID=551276 RepID=UPI00048CB9C1|nr:hypothetical protein [Pseudonocardia acaciae]